MLRAYAHRHGGGWEEVADFNAVSDLVAEPGALVWAIADRADLDAVSAARIAAELDLHPLAVEDALTPRQRPKLEQYEKHLFAVMHQLDPVEGQLEARQIACFVGAGYVLTVHDGADRIVGEAMRRTRNGARHEEQGPSFVMHALLDSIVDEYGAHADDLETEMESLEDAALGATGERLQGRLYSVKQRVARLRRYVLPGERVLAEVVNAGRLGLLSERTSAHFRDIHDHTLRIIDQVRNIDDLANAVIELQRSEQANALNETTKRLTGWAAIIAVPTFIASVYGMNFALVPADGSRFGFWFALGLMVTASVSLYLYFRRKRWI